MTVYANLLDILFMLYIEPLRYTLHKMFKFLSQIDYAVK